MSSYYTYDLWNGREIIGSISFMFPIMGESIKIYLVSILKQEYNKKEEVIDVPVIQVVTKQTYNETIYKTCLDVRRKSLRQRKILMDLRLSV